jgi:chromosome partitioning protein
VRKLVVANFKGGVGKTTLAVNLSVQLAHQMKRRVLLVDTDPSANVTAQLKVKARHTLSEVILGEVEARQAIVPVAGFGSLFVLPSSRATQATEMRIASQVGRERVLSRRLRGLDDFDYLIFDTPPSISIMAQNAFVYAQQVLIPVSMDPMSLLGASNTLGLLEEVRDGLEVPCSVIGIVPTFVDQRLIITRVVMNAIDQRFDGIPILPQIRTDTSVRKATASQVPIVEYAPRSRAAEDFRRLAQDLEARLAKEQIP